MPYIVIIEWDGKSPPTTYYQRLAKMGLHVRGDKDQDIVPRRRTRDGAGLILQEGCVVTVSESLAHAVAPLAKEYGARLVQIYSAEVVTEDYAVTERDREQLDFLNSVYGKRGHPTGDPTPIVVTCYECGLSYTTEPMRDTANCPVCHGMNIATRKDVQYAVHPYTPGSDLFSWWFGANFQTGAFETPVFDPSMPPPPALDPATLDYFEPQEKRVVEMLRQSPTVKLIVDKLQKIGQTDWALHYLTAVLCSRAHHDKDRRRQDRVSVITKLFERGVSPTPENLKVIKMFEDKDALDLFDAAPVLGVANTADLYFLIYQ